MLVIKIHPQLIAHGKGLCKMALKTSLHGSASYLLNHTGTLAILLICRDLNMTSLLIAHAVSHYHHAE